MASVFETVKENVTVKQAAERYGLEAKRGSMCCCPFHNDIHPSMKLNDGYYYCFSCHASGDVINLTAHLLGLSPYEAAIRLSQDFGIDVNAPAKPVSAKPVVSAVYCRRTVNAYETLIQRQMEKYAPQNEEEEYDARFCDAVSRLEKAEALLDSLYSQDKDEQRKTAEELSGSGELLRMEQYISEHKEDMNE